MAWSGLADLAVTCALIGLIWVAGAVLIKAADLVELRHAAVRQAHKGRRRESFAAAQSAQRSPTRRPAR